MFVRCIPANGVPWLHWVGDTSWACQGCGARGSQVPFETVVAFARWLGEVKRAHADCGDSSAWVGIGDPLNANRRER